MNIVLLAVAIQLPIALASVGSSFGETSFGKILRRRRDARNNGEDIVIRKFHVTSRVTSRFASTEVVSVVTNGAELSKEVVFEMKIPETAFTTNFTVTIGNDSYTGRVEEKHQAKKTYETARQRGQTAGHVSVIKPVRDTETFRVAMNVAAGADAEFVLVYQEMLFRRRGIYEHRISIRPKQVIDDLKVTVLITEPQGIDFIQVPPIQSNAIDRWVGKNVHNPLATIDRRSAEHARAVFSPTREDQIAMSSKGVMGDFVVRYDVGHEFNAGELQVLGSYFVHHFAPIGLKPARKNVVFVIDVSGSMSGRKMSQTKTALKEILGDMRDDDQFNIVTFNGYVNVWQSKGLVPLSDEFRQQSDAFVDSLYAGGSTDINRALLVGANILLTHEDNLNTVNPSQSEKSASMVIMLTDGNPTIGVTNFEAIQENVAAAVNGQLSIFCLGFGDDVDYEALEVLSLQNGGVARKIFEDADASLQLKGFYDEVANPVLFNLNVLYPGNAVDQNSLTRTTFPVFFDGSEIVVAGKLKSDDVSKLQTEVTAISFNDTLLLAAEIGLQEETIEDIGLDKDTVDDVTQRLWVYLTIKQVLDQMKVTANEALLAELKQKAIELSLEYNFVTEVTSLVVVADDDFRRLDSEDVATTVPPPVWRPRFGAGPPMPVPVAAGLPSRSHLSLQLSHGAGPPMPVPIAAGLPSRSHLSLQLSHGHGRHHSYRTAMYMHTALAFTHFLTTSGYPWPAASGVPYQATTIPPTTAPPTTPFPFHGTTFPGQPTTSPPPTSPAPGEQLTEFIIGGFGGRCDVGVKVVSVEPIICFRIPDAYIDVNYTLLETTSTGGELKITGSVSRPSTVLQSYHCWDTNISNTQNAMALVQSSHQFQSKSCSHIRWRQIPNRTFTGIVARLLSFIAGLNMDQYENDIVERNAERVLFLSNGAGHYQESLLNPVF